MIEKAFFFEYTITSKGVLFMIIDRLSVFVKWKFWKQLKKDSPQKEAAKK